MTSYDDVVIHIGYHKTGSTLLQERLFRPSGGCWSPWEQSFYHTHLLLDRPDRKWAGRVRRAFIPGIEEARNRGLVPVLTCEALSGDIWRPGQANGYGNFHVANVLAEAFPGARVAIVHREQVTMLTSLYKHSLRAHWTHSLTAFLDQSPLASGMPPAVNFGYLEYSWLLDHYLSLLGSDHVFAVPFELLRDNAAWAGAWGRFLGRPIDAGLFAGRENPAYSASTIQAKRVANFSIPETAMPMASRTGRLVNRVAYQLDAHTPSSIRQAADRRLLARVAEQVGDRFNADNARLQEMLGEDWSSFGY